MGRHPTAAARDTKKSGPSYDLSQSRSIGPATAEAQSQASEPEPESAPAQAFHANQGSYASDREIVSATAAAIPQVPDRPVGELVWYTDSVLREGIHHCRQMCHRIHFAIRITDVGFDQE